MSSEHRSGPSGDSYWRILDELSKVFSREDDARAALRRAGFPLNAMPAFTAPGVFWGRVLEMAHFGVIDDSGGIQPIVDAALQAFPGNRIFLDFFEQPSRERKQTLHPSRHQHNLGDKPNLVGRSYATRQVALCIQAREHLLIHGPRGSGKAAIARLAALECLERGEIDLGVLVTPPEQADTIDTMLSLLFDEVVRVVEPDHWILNEINLHKKRDFVKRNILSKRRWVLILDGAENGRVANSFFAKLFHELANEATTNERHPLSGSIIATSVVPSSFEITSLRHLPVHSLSEEDTVALINERSRVHELSKHDKRTIRLISRGNPGLVQVMIDFSACGEAARVWEQYNKDPVTISERGHSQVFEFLFSFVWKRLSEIQKKALVTLSLPSKGMALGDLTSIIDANCEESEADLAWLERLGLISVSIREYERFWEIKQWARKATRIRMRREEHLDVPVRTAFVEHHLRQSESREHCTAHEAQDLLLAVQEAGRLGMNVELSRCVDAVNKALWISGHWTIRVEINRLLLSACKSAGNDLARARILVQHLGFTFLRFEDLLRAEQYVRVGLSMFQKSEYAEGEALAVRHLAKVSLLMGEYGKLKPDLDWPEYFQIAYDLYKESERLRNCIAHTGRQQDLAVANLKLDFGRLYWLWGRKSGASSKAIERYSDSIRVSEAGRSIFEQYADLKGVAKAHGNLGNAYKDLARTHSDAGETSKLFSALRRAESAYRRSLDIAEDLGKVDEEAHAKWGLAEVYEIYYKEEGQEHMRDSAISLARDAHRLYVQLATPGDIEATGELLERLEGLAYSSVGD